jgi:hypothetical protein
MAIAMLYIFYHNKKKIKEVKQQPTEWEKNLNIKCLIRDLYLDNIKKDLSYNSVIKRKVTQKSDKEIE